jgi:hypothetical protein
MDDSLRWGSKRPALRSIGFNLNDKGPKIQGRYLILRKGEAGSLYVAA